VSLRRIPRNYEEARELADQARARAFARIDWLTKLEEAHRTYLMGLPKRSQPEVLPPLSVAVDRRVNDDPQFKAHVADNRWYIDYATMYAQGEQLELLRQLNRNITLLLERTTTNDARPHTQPHPRITRAERG